MFWSNLNLSKTIYYNESHYCNYITLQPSEYNWTNTTIETSTPLTTFPTLKKPAELIDIQDIKEFYFSIMQPLKTFTFAPFCLSLEDEPITYEVLNLPLHITFMFDNNPNVFNFEIPSFNLTLIDFRLESNSKIKSSFRNATYEQEFKVVIYNCSDPNCVECKNYDKG